MKVTYLPPVQYVDKDGNIKVVCGVPAIIRPSESTPRYGNGDWTWEAVDLVKNAGKEAK